MSIFEPEFYRRAIGDIAFLADENKDLRGKLADAEKILENHKKVHMADLQKAVQLEKRLNKSDDEKVFHMGQAGGARQRAEDLESQLSTMRDGLAEYGQHSSDCILSYFSAGRATENGGYEVKYREKWYQAKPVDETPKCECGFLALLSKSEVEDGGGKE